MIANEAIEGGTYAGLFLILGILLVVIVLFVAMLMKGNKSNTSAHQRSLSMDDPDLADWGSRHPGNAKPKPAASKRRLYY